MSDNTELKPCPFCGGQAAESGESLIHGIRCTSCQARMSMIAGDVYGGISEVIGNLRAAWNRRSPVEAQPSAVLVAALRDARATLLREGWDVSSIDAALAAPSAVLPLKGEVPPFAFCNCPECDAARNSAGEGAAAPSVPKMPDDYWLHVRGCDCDYCTWERANGGDPLTQAAKEWAASAEKCCAGKRGPYIAEKCVTCPFKANAAALSAGAPSSLQGERK